MELQEINELSPGELQKLVKRIGHTPMQPIQLVINGKVHNIHLKLEGANPTGSMKDRTASALMQSLHGQGRLQAGSIVIESTSGNLGVALALLCKARGCNFLAVIDPKTTQENVDRMRALGAYVEMVRQADEANGYLLSRLQLVKEYCHRSDVYVWADQYTNPANPHIHYVSLGPEIYRQMNGRIDAIFIPVSTGGTLAGVGRFMREVSPSTRVIGVDAYGSVIFGGPAAPRKLTGIGSSRSSSFLSANLYNTHMLVKDEEAFTYCRLLDKATGIRVGGSSGAVLAACTQYLLAHPEIQDTVCICADRGENYASTIFNDKWIEQQAQLSHDVMRMVKDILRLAPPII